MRQVNDMGKKIGVIFAGQNYRTDIDKECGLDNRRSQKIRYRLNEGNATKKNDSFEEMAEEQRETETRNIQNIRQHSNGRGRKRAAQVNGKSRNSPDNAKRNGWRRLPA